MNILRNENEDDNPADDQTRIAFTKSFKKKKVTLQSFFKDQFVTSIAYDIPTFYGFWCSDESLTWMLSKD